MLETEKKELLDITHEMLKENLVIGSSGNASFRVEDKVVITPSAVRYHSMTIDDVMILDLEGNVLEGHRNPSIESPAHLEIYRRRTDAKAVVHAHSIYATALALLDRPLPPVIDEVVPKLGGEIRLAEYAMPGTKALAENVVAALENRSAVFLKNHGALCIGKSITDALYNSILLERTCKIYLLALQVGTPTELPEDVVEDEMDVWEMMKDY